MILIFNNFSFDKTGMYLFTGSDDGHVFVVDGRPSAKFEFLAHTGERSVL